MSCLEGLSMVFFLLQSEPQVKVWFLRVGRAHAVGKLPYPAHLLDHRCLIQAFWALFFVLFALSSQSPLIFLV